EAPRAQAAKVTAVGGDEEERMGGTDDARSGWDVPRDRGGVRASELDQCCDSRRVVVRAGPRADVVEVRQDGECLRGAARDGDNQVLEADSAPPRDGGEKRLTTNAKPEVRDLIGEPLPPAGGSG